MANIDLLAQQAIQASLNCLYPKAVKINQDILKIDPRNLPAINRLGKCYFLLNNLTKAKKYYRMATLIDPYNAIAKKNLSLLNKTKHNSATNNNQPNCYEFLEIPGKTQTVSLTRLPEQDKICHLKTGQLVSMAFKSRSVRVYVDSCYIGSLPDDIALRLLNLVTLGNRYMAYVRSISQKKVSLFIKEVFQSKKNQNRLSFPHTFQDNSLGVLSSVLI